MTQQDAIQISRSGVHVQKLLYNRRLSMDQGHGNLTLLGEELCNGLPDAESRLLSRVYVELKRLARNYLRRERAGHSLGATDLVHEAYLRMTGAEGD